MRLKLRSVFLEKYTVRLENTVLYFLYRTVLFGTYSIPALVWAVNDCLLIFSQ